MARPSKASPRGRSSVKFVELANYRIVESQSPTAEQLKVRESWLKR